MKVKALIERLARLNPESQVACSQENPDGRIRFFEIDDVSECIATSSRHDDGTVSLRFGTGSEATGWVTIDLAPDEPT